MKRKLPEVHTLMRDALLHAFAENTPQTQAQIANAADFVEGMLDALAVPMGHRVGVTAVLMERYLAKVLGVPPLFP